MRTALCGKYVADTDVRTVREKNSDTAPFNFTPFELACQALTDKLRRQVFNLRFSR